MAFGVVCPPYLVLSGTTTKSRMVPESCKNVERDKAGPYLAWFPGISKFLNGSIEVDTMTIHCEVPGNLEMNPTQLLKFERQIVVLRELQAPFVRPSDPRLWTPLLAKAKPERLPRGNQLLIPINFLGIQGVNQARYSKLYEAV